MTELERQINRNLHLLDRAHLQEKITHGEYRERRRRLLTPLITDSQVVTARISIAATGAASLKTQKNQTIFRYEKHAPHQQKIHMPPSFFNWKYWVAGGVGVLVVVVIIYLSVRSG
jgi:hypothetical protein